MDLELYTVKEVSNILKCSTASIYELVRQGKISPITKIGKKILISNITLQRFILGKSVNDLLKTVSTN